MQVLESVLLVLICQDSHKYYSSNLIRRYTYSHSSTDCTVYSCSAPPPTPSTSACAKSWRLNPSNSTTSTSDVGLLNTTLSSERPLLVLFVCSDNPTTLSSTSKGSATFGGGVIRCFNADPLVNRDVEVNDVVDALEFTAMDSDDVRGLNPGRDAGPGARWVGLRGPGE